VMLMKILVVIAAVVVMTGPLMVFESHALQTVTLEQGTTQFVNISDRDLNVIRIPGASNIKAYTAGRNLDVRVEGQNIFVHYNGVGSDRSPQELFIATSTGLYLLMLTPKGIPAEMIVLRTPMETVQDAAQWEASHDHITGLKELIKAMYLENPPFGYTVVKVDKDVTRWKNTKQRLLYRYVGATMEGEIHLLRNNSNTLFRVNENELYEKGVLAVSIDRHNIPPMQETRVYLVRVSASQRDADAAGGKYNPLEVIRKKQPFGGSSWSRTPQLPQSAVQPTAQ